MEDNILNNLPILLKDSICHQVEMCAITDHDIFNYELYSELKKEELKDNCILKVLPGVEFVEGKVIHIVRVLTLFSRKWFYRESRIRNIMYIMRQ